METEELFLDNQAENESLNTPNFFVTCLFHVKDDHVEDFRNYISQFVIEARKIPGVLAFDVVCSCTDMGLAEPKSIKSHVEFMLLEKWVNKRLFDDSITSPFVLEALQYSAEVQNLVSFPQISMWQKVNGLHAEALSADRLNLGPTQQRRNSESNFLHYTVSVCADQPMYVMTRRRTVKKSVNPTVLLQIMCRLAQLSIESEAGCISYDILTSRSDEGKDDVLECAAWKSKEEFDKHLGASYVQQSESIKPAFEDNNTAKFWMRHSDGLMESNPKEIFRMTPFSQEGME